MDEELVWTPPGGALPPAVAAGVSGEVARLRVLLGPADNDLFSPHIGPPPYPCEVRLFRLPRDPTTPFARVVEQLGGWEPDAVLYLDPGCLPLLPGIEHAPWPLVGVGNDWQWSIGRIRTIAAQVDWLLLDRWGCELARAAGVENVSVGYRFGSYDPEVDPGAAPEVERDLDVSLVSHWKMPWNWERRRLMWQVGAELGARRRVLFTDGLYGAAYRDVLRRSRIVFMNCLRREFAYRALEVLASGAMFMCEAGNLEIREFLREGEHFVTFDGEEDLARRLEYYLERDDERQRVARAGQAHVRRYAYPYPLAFYLERLLGVGLEPLRERARARVTARPRAAWEVARLHFAQGLTAARSYQAATRWLASDEHDGRRARDENLAGLCHLGLARRLKDRERAAALAATGAALVRSAHARARGGESPGDVALAVLAFNEAESAWDADGRAASTRDAYLVASARLEAVPAVDPEGEWPDALQLTQLHPHFYVHAFARGAAWGQVPRRYRDLLLGRCAWRLGELERALGRPDAAAAHFLRWYDLLDAGFGLEQVEAVETLVEAGRDDEALALAERILDGAPLEPRLWLTLLDLYLARRPAGWAERAGSLLQRASGVVRSMPQLREVEADLERRARALAAARGDVPA